jgi:hypothetical protein
MTNRIQIGDSVRHRKTGITLTVIEIEAREVRLETGKPDAWFRFTSPDFPRLRGRSCFGGYVDELEPWLEKIK